MSSHSIWIPTLQDNVLLSPFTTQDQIDLGRAIASDPFASFHDFNATFLSIVDRKGSQSITPHLTSLDKFAIAAQFASNDVCGSSQAIHITCTCGKEIDHNVSLAKLWGEAQPQINRDSTEKSYSDGKLTVYYKPLTVIDEMKMIVAAARIDHPVTENVSITKLQLEDNIVEVKNVVETIALIPERIMSHIRNDNKLTSPVYDVECPACKKQHRFDLTYNSLNSIIVWLLGINLETLYDETAFMTFEGFRNISEMTALERAHYIKIIQKRVEAKQDAS